MKSDDEIRKDVIEEIRWDPQLSNIAPQIGVIVKSGIVTLSGVVEYYAQKLAAEKATQRVSGVAVLASELEVRSVDHPETITDSQIGEAIQGALKWHSAVNEDLVDIKVEKGWIYLEGTVDWDYERKAAEAAIENIIGVKGIINSIKIKNISVEPKEIRKKISQAFHRHASIDSGTISIAVSGTVVTLTGKVRTWEERREAENVSLSMPGVTEVINNLMIESESYVF